MDHGLVVIIVKIERVTDQTVGQGRTGHIGFKVRTDDACFRLSPRRHDILRDYLAGRVQGAGQGHALPVEKALFGFG